MSNAITSWQAGAVECVVSSLTVRIRSAYATGCLRTVCCLVFKTSETPALLNLVYLVAVLAKFSGLGKPKKNNKEEECDAACASPNKLLRFHFQISVDLKISCIVRNQVKGDWLRWVLILPSVANFLLLIKQHTNIYNCC